MNEAHGVLALGQVRVDGEVKRKILKKDLQEPRMPKLISKLLTFYSVEVWQFSQL